MIDWDAVVLGPCEAVFGEDQTPTYTPPGGVAFAVPGIFDDAHTALVMGDAGDPDVSTVNAVIGVRLSQFPADQQPVQDGKLRIPRLGKTFKVVDVQPDGHGAAKLILSETAP